ncbi:MAG: serine protease [Porticoccaceae bacterium]
MSRHSFGAMCIFIMAISAVGSAFAGLPETIARVKPSIVGIGSVFPVKAAKFVNSPMTLRGTGFVVGNGRQVVTNFHAIQKPLDESAGELLAVFTGEGKNARVYPARIVRTDPSHDLALLEFNGDALPAMTLNMSRSVREGEDIVFTGFPIGLVLGLQPVTHRGIVSAVTPIVMPALSAKMLTPEQIKRAREPFNVYQLDATAYPGNSGSPVYDPETGEVLAVINSVFVKESRESMLSDPSNISYAIPVVYIRALVDGPGAAQQ